VLSQILMQIVSYHEVPRTPPLTPVSSRSMTPSIHEPYQPRVRELTPRQRSPSRIGESLELTEYQGKSKLRERKGER
jgi:hypothetical protein